MFKKQRKSYIVIIILTFIFVSFFTSSVSAEDAPLLIEKDILLKNGCVVKDTNAETHIFPKDDSPSEFLGICVLAEALEQGFISELKLINDPNLGIYVQSINSIEPGNTEFWGLWQNGEFADCGIECLTILEGDTLSLILTDWMAETESTKIIFHINELVSSIDTTPPTILLTGSSSINLNIGDSYTELGATATDNIDTSISVVVSGSVDTNVAGSYTINYNASDTAGNNAIEVGRTVTVGTTSNDDSENGNNGGSSPPQSTFNVQNALAYLKSVQSENGSFGDFDLYTDWVGIAFGAMNVTDSSRNLLLTYLESRNRLSSVLTDNERRTMTLLALGQNPYSFNGMNYVNAITNSFDGTQLGDTDLDNDDIFGLIVLQKVGYSKNDEIIQKIISFILSAQVSDGSWDNSPDMTAAAIQALSLFDSVSGVSSALNNASLYLQDTQSSDGGWENVFSTSWVLQAMNALSASWEKNNKTGMDYLGEQQTEDGVVSPSSETLENRIWATSYAIAAASEKPWTEIMQSVSKPSEENEDNNQNDSNDSLTDVPENNNLETSTNPASPVTCTVGDLFSAITGEACTEFTPKNTTNTLMVNSETTVIPKPEIKKTKVSQLPTLEEVETPASENVGADTLTATVVNAIPTSTNPHTIPIVLGVLSGIVLLYFASKFLIK